MGLRVAHIVAYCLGMLVCVGLCLYAWQGREHAAPEPEFVHATPGLDFADAGVRSFVLSLQAQSPKDWLGARCAGTSGSGERELVLSRARLGGREDRYELRLHPSYGSALLLHREGRRLEYQPVAWVALSRTDVERFDALLASAQFHAMRPEASSAWKGICDMGQLSLEECRDGRYFAAKSSCFWAAEGLHPLANEIKARLRSKAGLVPDPENY